MMALGVGHQEPHLTPVGWRLFEGGVSTPLIRAAVSLQALKHCTLPIHDSVYWNYLKSNPNNIEIHQFARVIDGEWFTPTADV